MGFFDENNKYMDKDYKGDKSSNLLKRGPLEERSCTDIICCVIFLLFIIGLLVISIIGFKKGDPLLLATPFDPDGNACGESPGFKDFPFIYFSRPSSEYLF